MRFAATTVPYKNEICEQFPIRYTTLEIIQTHLVHESLHEDLLLEAAVPAAAEAVERGDTPGPEAAPAAAAADEAVPAAHLPAAAPRAHQFLWQDLPGHVGDLVLALHVPADEEDGTEHACSV